MVYPQYTVGTPYLHLASTDLGIHGCQNLDMIGSGFQSCPGGILRRLGGCMCPTFRGLGAALRYIIACCACPLLTHGQITASDPLQIVRAHNTSGTQDICGLCMWKLFLITMVNAMLPKRSYIGSDERSGCFPPRCLRENHKQSIESLSSHINVWALPRTWYTLKKLQQVLKNSQWVRHHYPSKTVSAPWSVPRNHGLSHPATEIPHKASPCC